MPFRAALFDLDGTMLETDHLHEGIFRDLLAPRGIHVDTPFYMAHIHGRLNEDMFAELLPDEPDPRALSEEKEARFRAILPRPYPPAPGLPAFLDRVEGAGWVMAVVTNAPRPNAEAMMAAIGVETRIPVLVVGEECARGKPAPDPYAAACERLGVAPAEAVAFEDSPSGLRSAAAAGCHVVGVRSALTDAALRAEGAALTVADFTDPALNALFAEDPT
ncbi:HAD family hydrolase [Wenxinia saemankumensis]|uniref:Phosphoglycolate phosphatase n=1 Tax=Wenxinia saemankumensis TaxID=1447782 RepID=A0A1M6HC76_9RHOB|nr:HAD-IA family hydrolase [Wenxinia saemankumensis]SHJ19754.1 phosphoglycolate phosphatase [Wenxinia saemankumensis]